MADVVNTSNHSNPLLRWVWAPKHQQMAANRVEIPELIASTGDVSEKSLKVTVVHADDRVAVTVGLAPKTRTWRLHTDLLRKHSPYVARILDSSDAASRDTPIFLADEDPAAFALFVTWMYSGASAAPISVSGPELDHSDPWVVSAPHACALAAKLESPFSDPAGFARYALAMFARAVRRQRPDTLLAIYRGEMPGLTEETSPARRFATAWLWYMRDQHAHLWQVPKWHFITSGDVLDETSLPLVKRLVRHPEFASGVETAVLSRPVDPHWLDITHWTEKCAGAGGCSVSNARPQCGHVPYPCTMEPWARN